MPELIDDIQYLTKVELAKRWRVKIRTIELWVRKGQCPKPLKLGYKSALWPIAEVIAHEQAIRAKCDSANRT